MINLRLLLSATEADASPALCTSLPHQLHDEHLISRSVNREAMKPVDARLELVESFPPFHGNRSRMLTSVCDDIAVKALRKEKDGQHRT